MSQDIRDRIAQLFHDNHEEQCCNCVPWGDLTNEYGGRDKADWLRAADAILAEFDVVKKP